MDISWNDTLDLIYINPALKHFVSPREVEQSFIFLLNFVSIDLFPCRFVIELFDQLKLVIFT